MKIYIFIIFLFFTSFLWAQDCDLITNTDTYWPIPTVDKPDYLVPYTDIFLGTTITRIVGNPYDEIPNLDEYWPKQARHGYSKRQPWNSDQTMIFLDRCNNLFMDGHTFDPLFEKPLPSSRVRWSYTEPNFMYYIDNSGIGKWNVISDTTYYVVKFSGYYNCTIGDGEGTFTWDNKKVAVLATRSSDKHIVIFVANTETGKISADIDMNSITEKVNNCTISPLGTFISIVGDFNTTDGKSDRLQVRYAVDTLGHNYGDLAWEETLYGVPSHFDTQIDQDGDEIIAGVAKSDYKGNNISGKVIKRKLYNGDLSVICNYRYASHTSGRCYNKPGWIFVNFQTDSPTYAPYINELVAVKLDGSETRRICQMHSNNFTYVAEAHGVPTPDGTRAMWASDWDENDYPIQSYVADFREGNVACDRVTLKVNVEGSGKVNAANNLTYIKGSTFKVTASPVNGWVFNHWEGDLTGNENPVSITLDTDKDIKAVFSEVSDVTAISVCASSDDAEEYTNEADASHYGKVNLNSGDLELLYDGEDAGHQYVGVRFTNVSIPKDAKIGKAYISFTCKDAYSYDVKMKIQAEACDNSETFTNTEMFNISSRNKTDSILWQPEGWTKVNGVYDTPDLRLIVQQVIDRDNWHLGNAMSFIISNDGMSLDEHGRRRAYSYDGDITKAPVLHIQIDTTTAVRQKINNVPLNYSLSNYPNPFNPSTNINFTLPQSEKIKLTVYDVRGRVVAVLADGVFQRGKFNVKWNTTNSLQGNLSSGMFVAQLTAGNYAKCIKMILLK